MKTFKLAQKTLLAIGLSTIIGSSLVAETIDVSKSIKDIKVMTRIIEASLESLGKAFPGRPRIKGTYLAKQGYLFTIQLNGMGSFGIPGVASWDEGRLELDIPEIISEALASVEEDIHDISDAPEPPEPYEIELAEIAEPVIRSFDSLYDNDEFQDKLRELREKQRTLRRETYQIRREIRRATEDIQRKKLESKLEKNNDELKQYSKDYNEALNAYKSERKQRQVKKSSNAISAVFSTICDYGQSLRALDKNEKFTLMVKGGVNSDGKKATQFFVIEQKALKNCSSSKKLKSNALHYSL